MITLFCGWCVSVFSRIETAYDETHSRGQYSQLHPYNHMLFITPELDNNHHMARELIAMEQYSWPVSPQSCRDLVEMVTFLHGSTFFLHVIFAPVHAKCPFSCCPCKNLTLCLRSRIIGCITCWVLILACCQSQLNHIPF